MYQLVCHHMLAKHYIQSIIATHTQRFINLSTYHHYVHCKIHVAMYTSSLYHISNGYISFKYEYYIHSPCFLCIIAKLWQYAYTLQTCFTNYVNPGDIDIILLWIMAGLV